MDITTAICRYTLILFIHTRSHHPSRRLLNLL